MASYTGTVSPDFDIDLVFPLVGDMITLQWGLDQHFATAISFSSYFIDDSLYVSLNKATFGTGTHYFRARHSRGQTDSGWSNTVVKKIFASEQPKPNNSVSLPINAN